MAAKVNSSRIVVVRRVISGYVIFDSVLYLAAQAQSLPLCRRNEIVQRLQGVVSPATTV